MAEAGAGAAPPPGWLVERDGALVLRVRVQPGAKRAGVAGLHGGALRIRLKAPPLEGRANDELIRFLAEAFAVPRERVEILRGRGGREKTVRVRAPARRPDAGWVSG